MRLFDRFRNGREPIPPGAVPMRIELDGEGCVGLHATTHVWITRDGLVRGTDTTLYAASAVLRGYRVMTPAGTILMHGPINPPVTAVGTDITLADIHGVIGDCP